MSFILSKFLSALISPLGTALALWLLALFLSIFHQRRLAIILSSTGLIWLWAWSLPMNSDALRSYMEKSYPPMALQDVPFAPALVVLGGGVTPARLGQPWPDLGSSADRVWHAARLYHAGKTPLLLLSGGSDPSVSLTSEAAAMRSFLLDLGVPNQAIILEQISRSTKENAHNSAILLHQRGIDKVLLATSALHMDRARRHFELEGLTIVPVAIDHQGSPSKTTWMYLLPDAGALAVSASVLKEWVGWLIFSTSN